MLDRIELIPYDDAYEFVSKHHYSRGVMPKITKYSIGGFKDDKLVAVATLGYGTRPLHTIRKIFPTLTPKDYLELGRLCVLHEMPRNTESYFLARIIEWIKINAPERLVLYSWSDGLLGKPGFVYAASNFYYGGYIWTETYLDNSGNRAHVRTIQGNADLPQSSGKFKTRKFEEISKLGYQKIFGMQFRYLYPLCNKRRWRDLVKTSTIKWSRGPYPKLLDCRWKKQVSLGQLEYCNIPEGIEKNYGIRPEY